MEKYTNSKQQNQQQEYENITEHEHKHKLMIKTTGWHSNYIISMWLREWLCVPKVFGILYELCERLGVTRDELEEVVGDVWASLLSILPPQPIKKMDGWINWVQIMGVEGCNRASLQGPEAPGTKMHIASGCSSFTPKLTIIYQYIKGNESLTISQATEFFCTT